MAIHITGDTHGNLTRFSTKNLAEAGVKLNKGDYIIIAGDFGMIWEQGDIKKLKWWNNWIKQKGVTLLFVDGNHENFDLLNEIPITERFGGKVQEVHSHIIHLMRGELYTIDGKTIFTFGGGKSIDKLTRKEGKSWWKEEMPNQDEYVNGLNKLLKNPIDYIITHTAPTQFIEDLLNHQVKSGNELTNYLDFIWDILTTSEDTFKKWYCGHFHCNRLLEDKITKDPIQCLYNEIQTIE